MGLGHVASDTTQHGQARELWRKALEIYEELGVPFAETVRREIFAGDLDPDQTAELIDRWCSRASRSRLAAFVKVAKTDPDG